MTLYIYTKRDAPPLLIKLAAAGRGVGDGEEETG